MKLLTVILAACLLFWVAVLAGLNGVGLPPVLVVGCLIGGVCGFGFIWGLTHGNR